MSQHYLNTGQPFEEFEKSSKQEWVEQIKLEFPAKKSAQILSGKTREGLAILPVYTREDMATLHLPASQLKNRRSWNYHELIILYGQSNAKEVNALIMQALHAGAAGIDFHVPDADDADKHSFQELLAGTEIPHCHFSFYLKNGQAFFFDAFLQYVTGPGLKDEVKGTLFLNPDFSKPFSSHEGHQYIANFLSNSSCPSYRVLGISSSVFERKGGSVVQELAYTLSWIVHCFDRLTDLGIEIKQLCNNLEVELTTQSDYLIDIAKFRAIRVLLSQLAQAYGIKDIALSDWNIKATSGSWNKTVVEDAYRNLLCNTTEAMGAIIGGCNTIAILPHDFALTHSGSGSFGNRMARNVSNILEYEAHMNKVDDPAAGSYFLENMTWQIISQVWQEFLAIEQLGGFGEALGKGAICLADFNPNIK